MRVRKNALSLTNDEKWAFVEALLRLKREGRYDEYVHWHHHVMMATVLPHEPRDGFYRNGAHRGPAFLPWHREFLLQLETDLQSIDSALTLPFWDWTHDAALPDPTLSQLWAENFMGGNGIEADDWRVATGPFAFVNGRWPIPEAHDGPALRRQFGVMINSLPTDADLRLAAREILYDTPNYDSSPFTLGFRNRIEGWVTRRGDHRVTTEGSQLHNRVHLWVGGSISGWPAARPRLATRRSRRRGSRCTP
jgi:tyrosinase